MRSSKTEKLRLFSNPERSKLCLFLLLLLWGREFPQTLEDVA